jgi:iron(III) transport system substrate-binding protein
MVRGIVLLKRIIPVMIGVLCVLLSISSVALVAQVQYEPELVIISPHTKDFLDAEKLAFENYASSTLGTKVTVLFDMQGSPQAYGKIVEWAGRPNADIFWGGEINLYTALVEKALLEAHTRAATQEIPADLQKIPLK